MARWHSVPHANLTPLLDANPLEDIGNLRSVHAVVLDRRLLERAELEAALPTF